MPKIKTESLREGLVVATEVRNMDNMLLVPAGCVIAEKHIEILSAWGISEVEVETYEGMEESVNVLEQLPPERLEQLTKELESVFWEPPDVSPVQVEAFKLALCRKVKQACAGPVDVPDGKKADDEH